MLYLSQDDTRRLMPIADVAAAVEQGMRQEAGGLAESAARVNLSVGPQKYDASALRPGRVIASVWMGGSADQGATIRAVSSQGPLALYFDPTGVPAALIDFGLLQLFRTGAAAAIGTKFLARPDSSRFALLGSGRFARASLAAHAAAMSIGTVRNYSPNRESREQFARTMEAELGVEVRPADSAAEAVGDADVVLVCTNRNAEHDAPVLLGDWLRPGMHVTSNGGASELDTSVYERATRVVVDDVHEVRAQIWDVKRAVAAGVFTWDSLDELRFVVAGKVAGRQGDDDITIVRNRGSGVQDLYPTAEMYRRATAQGVGRDLGRVASPLP